MSVRFMILGVSAILALELPYLCPLKADAAQITDVTFLPETFLVSIDSTTVSPTTIFRPGETMVFGGRARVAFTIDNSGVNDMGDVELSASVDLTLDTLVRNFSTLPLVNIPSGFSGTIASPLTTQTLAAETWVESQIGKHQIAWEIDSPRLIPREPNQPISVFTGTRTFSNTVEVVPEPITIFGSGLALGFGAYFKKEYSRKQKKAKAKA